VLAFTQAALRMLAAMQCCSFFCRIGMQHNISLISFGVQGNMYTVAALLHSLVC